MTAAFDAWVQRARSVRIEDIIARRNIALTGKNERVGPCPICGGNDRFGANVIKQRWNCRGCDKGGDVIALVQHLDGVDFTAACERLTGEPPPSRPNGKMAGSRPRAINVATWTYENADGSTNRVIERFDYLYPDGRWVEQDGKRKKTFKQKSCDANGRFVYTVEGVAHVPYRLPEIIEAISLDHIIAIVEGEKCADTVSALGIASTTNPMGAGKWTDHLSSYFKDADVVLVPDNDQPGFEHIEKVGAALSGVAKRIRVLMLPGLMLKGDVTDWLEAGGTRQALDDLIATAPDFKPKAESNVEAETADAAAAKASAEASERELLDRLAAMSDFDYARRRRDEARDLGIRASDLDRERERRRAEQADHVVALKGHWVVEPWSEPVATAALLDALMAPLQRHVVFSSDAALATTLWSAFAWVHEAATHSPILLVTSAEAGSGKTTLASLVEHLTPRGLSSVGVSEAALFRSVEQWQPTLIIDETDVLLKDNEPLRAVVNSGWTCGSGVLRCIGEDKTPHLFPTFTPKLVAMVGKRLPATTLSRCIVIELKRKLASERVEHFRCIDDNDLRQARSKALRWATDNVDLLKGSGVALPQGFDNRVGDNWRTMLAIADLAGRDWPERARGAALRLAGKADVTTQAVRLLAAVAAVFAETKRDTMSGADLIAHLTAAPDSEWHEYKAGKMMTQAQLARVLGRFGVVPTQTWTGSHNVRAYHASDLIDPTERYVPPEHPV